MAHKKAGGSTSNNRDSAGQRLGVKLYAGETAHAGQIIVRQRGTKIAPGKNVRRGKDDTLYAALDGIVQFLHRKKINFTGKLREKTIVQVVAGK